MPMSTKLPPKLQVWADARKRHRLSHAHVQMARELGMNPKKLGKIDNHDPQQWKAPLPQFIERCYRKRFGRDAPLERLTLEQVHARDVARKAAKRQARAERRQHAAEAAPSTWSPSTTRCWRCCSWR